MSHATLQVQIAQGVCTLTLNRPEVRNAMSLAMVSELLAALRAAEQDDGAHEAGANAGQRFGLGLG